MKKIILAISLLLILALMLGTPTALSGGKEGVVTIKILIDIEEGKIIGLPIVDVPGDKKGPTKVQPTQFPLTIGSMTDSMEVWISRGNPTCYITIEIDGVPHKIPYPC